MGVYGCEIIGNSNIFLHVVVILITFPILILKRSFEHYKRSTRTWLFDISKQLIGALLSLFTLFEVRNLSNFCTKYFITILADGLLMNFFSIGLLIIIQVYLSDKDRFMFTSGYYTRRKPYLSWLYQLMIWTVACV